MRLPFVGKILRFTHVNIHPSIGYYLTFRLELNENDLELKTLLESNRDFKNNSDVNKLIVCLLESQSIKKGRQVFCDLFIGSSEDIPDNQIKLRILKAPAPEDLSWRSELKYCLNLHLSLKVDERIILSLSNLIANKNTIFSLDMYFDRDQESTIIDLLEKDGEDVILYLSEWKYSVYQES